MHKNLFFNKLNLNINKQNTRGITLIALVITIIVLLILAGVSISMLTGTNGILTQAQNAKQVTEESAEKEKRQLSQIEASTHLENYDYTDAEGNTAKIPAGFAVSNVEGENLVSKGLVIIGTTGNEYVWIPCTTDSNDTNKLQYARETTEWLVENDNNTLATKDELELKGMTPSDKEIDNGITTKIVNEIAKQSENEKESVKNNGGYYIGRYEIGKDAKQPVIKQNQEPYTNIKWSEAYALAKGIDVGGKANSYLCSSYAWDTAIKFIQKHSNAINYGKSKEGLNENWWDTEVKDKSGNIIKKLNNKTLLRTGLTTPSVNIYDMGGNLVEFTTELHINSDEVFVVRGGNTKGGNKEYSFSAGTRWDLLWRGATGAVDFGFRTTLFL